MYILYHIASQFQISTIDAVLCINHFNNLNNSVKISRFQISFNKKINQKMYKMHLKNLLHLILLLSSRVDLDIGILILLDYWLELFPCDDDSIVTMPDSCELSYDNMDGST